MISLKKMTQEQFDNYFLNILFPDCLDVYPDVSTIIVAKNKFTFATNCSSCNDFKKCSLDYDIPKIFKKDDFITYLNVLTNLDIVDELDANYCECDDNDDEYVDDDLDSDDETEYFDDNDYEDDYSDGNNEY